MSERKKLYQEYINRWQLVKEKEDHEMRDASFDLLFKQTLSIWDISNSLHLFEEVEDSDYRWSDFQKKWIQSHARN